MSRLWRLISNPRVLLTLTLLAALPLLLLILHFLGPTAEVEYGMLKTPVAMRSYRIALPRHRTGRQQLPLVFAFHGTGSSADSLAEHSQWDAIASRHDLIVVYPEAVRGLWAVPGTASPEQLERDLVLFDALWEHLLEQYPVDSQRIYAIGMSGGACFVQHLAHERPEQLAAVVAHSHSPPQAIWESKPERPVPVMLIVGDADRQASSTTVQQAAQQYKERGYEVELIVVAGGEHRWEVSQNQAILRFLLRHRLPTAE